MLVSRKVAYCWGAVDHATIVWSRKFQMKPRTDDGRERTASHFINRAASGHRQNNAVATHKSRSGGAASVSQLRGTGNPQHPVTKAPAVAP